LATVGADGPIEEAALPMIRRRIRRLPVGCHGHVVGLIAESDVCRALLSLIAAARRGLTGGLRSVAVRAPLRVGCQTGARARPEGAPRVRARRFRGRSRRPTLCSWRTTAATLPMAAAGVVTNPSHAGHRMRAGDCYRFRLVAPLRR
jgi:CBS domain